MQLLQLEQFDKLWQIFDDAVKTGKYESIPHKLSDGENGRCANGLLFTYLSPQIELDPDKREKTEPDLYIAYAAIAKKFNIDWEFDDKLFLDLGIDEIIMKLKEDYKETGKVNQGCFTALNNRGYDFAQLRDIFKEMDV